jgi:hypothetical protein
MHFSEDDLKNALRRKDPGPSFTQRVMARVAQVEQGKRPAKQDLANKVPRGWMAWLGVIKLRPVMTALAAILLVAAASWMGYEKYREARIEQAREAEQKTILALRITNAKLNHVFQRVNESINEPAAQEPKIRRQSL